MTQDSLAKLVVQSLKTASRETVEYLWLQEIPKPEREMLEEMADLLMSKPGEAFRHLNVFLLYSGLISEKVGHRFVIFERTKNALAYRTYHPKYNEQSSNSSVHILGEAEDGDPIIAWKRAYLMANTLLAAV